MKQANRAIALVLCAVLVAALLSGCFKKEKEPNAPTDATTTQTTAQATSATTVQGEQAFVGYVNATTLNIRPTPDITSEPIGGLVFGDKVNVVGREGDWYKITFKDGFGYVSAQYIQDTVPTEGTTVDTTTVAEDTSSTTAIDSAQTTNTSDTTPSATTTVVAP